MVNVVNSFNRTRSIFAASAPGRADFLNTHQDYKGLPVVPVALDLRTYIVASRTNSPGIVEVVSMNLKERGERFEDTFAIQDPQYSRKGFFGNYLRAVAKVALSSGNGKRAVQEKNFGLHVTIESEVPLSAGLASSAALEVAFAKLLDTIYRIGLDKKSVAEAAYRAENVELGIPCGRLDQYGSSFGGIILLECKFPYRVKPIPFKRLCFVVADSGIRHSTAEIHPLRQSDLNRGLEQLVENKSVPKKLKANLGLHYSEANWIRLSEEELTPYISTIEEVAKKRILFTLRMQRSTEIALKAMKKQLRVKSILEEAEKVPGISEFLSGTIAGRSNSRLKILGQVMNYQHSLLRDLYDVSLPELEKTKDAMLKNGAYGAKISGAGLGGSLIGLVDDSKSGQRTLNAALDAGAKQGWVSSVGEGARIENANRSKIRKIIKLESN